jgi:HAD superfamily hydrolase (TIGR01509 family)
MAARLLYHGRMSPELIIFDCDGVLIDSEVLACRVGAECLAEHGVPVTADDLLEHYVGVSLASMLADLEIRHGLRLPVDMRETMLARGTAAAETELKAIEGVEAVVRAITCPVCVASSSMPEWLHYSLSLTGLRHYFEPHLFSAVQVVHGKPAPDLFLFAAEQMRVAPEATLVIEDSLAGVQGAVTAGMRVIGFTGGGHCRDGHAERLRAAGAFVVCDDMAAVARIVCA